MMLEYRWKGVSRGMLEQIMNSPNFDYMQRGLQAATLRHAVISDNIANVNTPNFKKSNVDFEELLAKELDMDSSGKLKMARTSPKHLPEPMRKKAQAKIQLEDDDTMRVDGNNVDIDVEMAGLAKNQLYYNALTTQLGGYMTRLKSVITSGQS